MFCPNCGIQVADGSIFCSKCGTQLAGAAPAPHNQPDYAQPNYSVRDHEMGMLTEIWRYFSQLSARYREYDATCKQVNYYARGAKSALLVWGCIAFSLGLFFTIGFAVDASTQEEMLEMCLPFLLLFALPGLLMIGGGIWMKVNNRMKLTKYQQQYMEQAGELYGYYIAYPGCLVGIEYSNPDTIAHILKQMQSGRAYTIRDAINLSVGDKANHINHYVEQLQRNTREISQQGSFPIILPASMFQG